MSIKAYLMEYVKHNQWAYCVLNSCGKVALGLCRKFVKLDDQLILFNSFGGKKYDDSTKEIYLRMKEDPRFEKYRLLWAFHAPEQVPEITEKIKTDNLFYFITALKARCWITNSAIQRGIEFKGKHTYYFNTWHGTPMKKMGAAMGKKGNNKILQICDVILAQSRYEAKKMSQAYDIPLETFKIFGLPRNDVLAAAGERETHEMRKKLGIRKDQMVILYAPTFRDYQLDAQSRCTLEIPIDYAYWQETLGENFVFLMRAHYEVAKHTKLPEDSRWRDYSNYPTLNDLMIASDVLISDYSSILFDYSILNRPMFCYTYDFDEYNEKRGLYFDVRNELSSAEDGNRLAELIANMVVGREQEKCTRFRAHYVEEYGDATRKSVELIYQTLSGNKGKD